MIEIENNNNPEETALVLIRLARVFAKDFHSDKRLIPFKKLSLKDLYEAVKKAPYLKDVIVENFIEPAIFFDPRILSRDCDDKTMFITSWAIATGKEHKFIISLMAQKQNWSHITPFYIFKNKAIPFDATYPDRPSKMGRLLFNPVKTKFFDTSGKVVNYPIYEIK